MNSMIKTDKLERCVRGSHGVCAWRTNIVDFVSRLNKTPMGDDEQKYLALKGKQQEGEVGPVFLYEVNQLEESIGGVSDAFRRDLADFLGVDGELPEIPHISTAGVLDFIPGAKEFSEDLMIDICDEQHSFIRGVLMEKAKNSSEWIRKYFIQSKDVRVSSKDYFVKRLEEWIVDPCIERRRRTKSKADIITAT